MYTIELEESELSLISKALDLYCRVGLGQFQYLDINTTVKNITYNKLTEEEFNKFEYLALELGKVYTRKSSGTSFGIFSKEVMMIVGLLLICIILSGIIFGNKFQKKRE